VRPTLAPSLTRAVDLRVYSLLRVRYLGHILILVENLSVPFDRRAWHEYTTLGDAGYQVSVICPRGRRHDHEPYAEIGGERIFRYPIPPQAESLVGYVREYPYMLWWALRLAWRPWRRGDWGFLDDVGGHPAARRRSCRAQLLQYGDQARLRPRGRRRDLRARAAGARRRRACNQARLRGPVFYRQKRMGRGGKPFSIYKFRSMYVGADKLRYDLADPNEYSGPMFKMKRGPRVTRISGWLRRWSVDELPQIITVMKGDMSLVGPRPLWVEEAEQCRGWTQKRLDITPSITGLWQVLGRTDIPFDEMVKLDYMCVTGWSLSWDVKLLLQTVPAVVQKRGAY
jgi:lipopolysaccharide/colanic/teichoic acid biosynthesis glycosyltransferase